MPQTRALLEAPPATLPARHELTQVAFYPQTRYHCGPAALATVLDFRQVAVTPEVLAPEVYLPEREGSLQVELVAAARARDMLPYPLAPELDDLLREVAAGNPVLVMQNLGLDWWTRWHYAVVVGYDLAAAELVLRSGVTKRHRVSLATFERTWARAGRWALVITEPGAPAVTAAHDPLLRAALDLEHSGRLAAARAAYAAAAERWPDSHAAWMALGNSHYRLGDARAAAAAFSAAIARAPARAAGWNNLAWALSESGCDKAAREALACALRLAPDDPSVQASLGELAAAPRATPVRDGCSVPACVLVAD